MTTIPEPPAPETFGLEAGIAPPPPPPELVVPDAAERGGVFGDPCPPPPEGASPLHPKEV